MSITFQPETERRIETEMKSGGYSSPDEVVIAALELLHHEQEDRSRDIEEVRRMIAVGVDQLDRGEGLDGEQAFGELLDELSVERRRAQ